MAVLSLSLSSAMDIISRRRSDRNHGSLGLLFFLFFTRLLGRIPPAGMAFCCCLTVGERLSFSFLFFSIFSFWSLFPFIFRVNESEQVREKLKQRTEQKSIRSVLGRRLYTHTHRERTDYCLRQWNTYLTYPTYLPVDSWPGLAGSHIDCIIASLAFLTSSLYLSLGLTD